MAEPTLTTKFRANLAHLRKQGASKARIQEEIDYWRGKLTDVSASERKLSGLEKVGAVASKFSSGATFGLLDEAAGVFSDDTENEQRFLQKQLEEENPKMALLAEIAGSVALPIPFVKGAPKTAGRLAKAGRVLLEGGLQGAASGIGNAEGGLEERVRAAGRGATAGSVAAGVIGGVTRAGAGAFRKTGEALGMTTPSLDDLVAKMTDDDLLTARRRFDELKGRGLADETMMADILPQGEGALRQAATTNRAVRKTVDKELRSRSTRLANEADARFSRHTGTTPASAEKTIDVLNEEAAQRASPFYKAASEEAAAAPPVKRLAATERKQLAEMGVPGGKVPTDPIDEALELPFVQQRIDQLRKAPRSRFATIADDDHTMLDQIYKDIGRQIRSLDRKDWSLRDDLIQQRAILAEAITSRAPSYRRALSEFADPMAHKDAYLLGHQKTPADVIPDELAGLEAATVPNYKQGKAQLLRRDVPNIDVGEFSRFQDVLAPIGTREKAAVFKATFGETAYTEYVKDLLAMAGLQRMKAGGGESTTVDKLLEQLQGDPEAISGMIAQLLRGNPMSAIAQLAPTNKWGQAIDKLRNSKVAQTNADFLLRRGEPEVSRSLDELVAMREAAQRPAWQSKTRRIVSRTRGAQEGRKN